MRMIDKAQFDTNDSKGKFDLDIESNSNSCKLKLGIRPQDKMIYICAGKTKYFEYESSQSCGNFVVNYLGSNYKNDDDVVIGDLGKYIITNTGIAVSTNNALTPGQSDSLNFEVVSKCGTYTFKVIFTYYPEECCIK
ncbi:hypothetical protein [Clostridium uliginosum]|uniref:Uncharacterized protein n=1 Tax=Clostridium uliginosum TaxID=119641 RepID=A0A1I1MIZ4_9CLOT|nr:hypothetical protein [Clostridium uliginosum]SFC85096.1 hypothetical protein SAMN05421842_11115 [Clostridium uliginosum]